MGLLSRFNDWFLSTEAWRKIARHHIAHFTFRTFGYPKFRMENYFKIKNLLNTDHESIYAFVSADTDSLAWRLNHLITKAKFGHAGFLYVDDKGDIRAKHMKGSGLEDWHILDLIKEVDRFAIIKLPLNKENLDKAKARFNKIIETSAKVFYDYRLEVNDDIIKWLDTGTFTNVNGELPLNLYCSEFVYVVGYSLVDDPDFVLQWKAGRKVFEPDDVYNGGEIIFEDGI